MALTDKKIQGSMPIREFPEKYNELIDELGKQLKERDERILNLESELTLLKRYVQNEQSRIRAEYQKRYDEYVSSFENQFNSKMEEFEKKFVTKSQLDTVTEEIEERIVNITNE